VSDALRDTRFVLRHLLQADRVFAALPAFAEVDAELIDQVVEAEHAFTQGVLAPLNASGDREGCRLEGGAVRTPAGFAAAWGAFVDAGWPSLACDPDDGGQGLPLPLVAPIVLRAVGLVLLAQLWDAADAAAAAQDDNAFATRKRATAAVFFHHLLPEFDGLLAQLRAVTREPTMHADALARSAGATPTC